MRRFDKKFWATAFTLTGTIIGAGILGLPYVFSQSGVVIGLMWVIFLGIIMIFVNLCLGEITLCTGGKHQLAGYAEKYLGKWGKRVMFFAVIFGIYSALLAYLIGEGQSFSQLFTGDVGYAVYFAIGFWLIMTFLLREGLKGLKRVEMWGVSVIIVIILSIVIAYVPQVDFVNYYNYNLSLFFLPFGVVLFALLGFTSIPELKMEIKGNEKKLGKAIFIGSVIPIILYVLFALVFVGVLGKDVTQVATLSFGPIVVVLGIFTMLTSYFVLSFSLKDMYSFDMGFSKWFSFFLASIVPLLAYLLISFLDLAGFIAVLGIGGVVSGGFTGILILLMNKRAKKIGRRKPEYSVGLNWFIVLLLSIVFIAGIVVELGF